ncbi:MAG: division/cell wall cluster transcriptional repressor MraZ [Gemmataceae bacterium]|nr:division/cell wall cluster transcriptional repressor MraZ [Gemmataceae bacterium]MCI0742690.1 division/cell wall cluster transcriptional repressor MraZ [Gemmataceae bacterium]
MLLTGTHSRTLDDKKRLVLPKRIREQLEEQTHLYVTPGQDQCLWLYDQGALEQLSTKLDQTPATDAEARVFRRLFFAQMEEVDIDKAGRILLPERLFEHAGLKQDVVLLGVRDRLEIWDAVRWRDYFARHGASYDAVAEAAFRK